jgi:hypothetical protein
VFDLVRERNEGKSFRIKGRLCFPQGLAGEGDILPVLFGRPDTLFLNGSLRWRRKRKIADWLTFIFSFAKRALSSTSGYPAVLLRAS